MKKGKLEKRKVAECFVLTLKRIFNKHFKI